MTMATSTIKTMTNRITSGITPKNGSNIQYFDLSIVGGSVVFGFEIYNDSYCGSTDTVLCTIPSQYAPKAKRYFCGFTTDGNFAIKNNALITVKSNGDVVLRTAETTGRYIFCSGAYAISV